MVYRLSKPVTEFCIEGHMTTNKLWAVPNTTNSTLILCEFLIRTNGVNTIQGWIQWGIGAICPLNGNVSYSKQLC